MIRERRPVLLAGRNSLIGRDKVVLDGLVRMRKQEPLGVPSVSTVGDDLPELHFIYRNQDGTSFSFSLGEEHKFKRALQPLTIPSWILDQISSLLAQDVKESPVGGRFGGVAQVIPLPSASLPPQGLAVGHFFPLAAH